MGVRRVAAALLATSVVAISSVDRAEAGPTKVADAPYPAEFRTRVRAAIERGVRYLRTKQIDDRPVSPRVPRQAEHLLDGVEYEEAAAVTWVLRRAGVAADDPSLAKAATVLRSRPPKTVDEAALVLLGLASPPLADGDPFAIEAPAKGKPAPLAVSNDDRASIDRAAKLLLARQITKELVPGLDDDPAYRDAGGWGADLGKYDETSDVPSTYLALLALEAAARIGVSVPAKTYVAAATLLVGWQAPKGASVSLRMNEVRDADRFEWPEKAQARGFGWSGTMADEPSGYDTVGAAVALVVCQDALRKEKTFSKDLRQRTRSGIRDALAWVQENYDITKNPAKGKAKRPLDESLYHHHWLQGLARLSIHARMRFVGTHDWYAEGAEELLKSQAADGSWHPIWWQNCYALLFLMRASLQSTVPVVTESAPK